MKQDWDETTYLFELEDNKHVRATAIGVHVSGSCSSGPGALFHQLRHLHFKILTGFNFSVIITLTGHSGLNQYTSYSEFTVILVELS